MLPDNVHTIMRQLIIPIVHPIPNKGERQIRYYGRYSNKRRGMRKSPQADSSTFCPDEYWEKLEEETAFRKKRRMIPLGGSCIDKVRI